MISPKKRKSNTDADRKTVKNHGSAVAPSVSSTLAFWKEEVEALKDGQYESMDEAVDALISKVGARLHSPVSEREAAFLRQIIALDPEITCRISKLLKVK